jgi:hypothetical protein
LSLWFISCGLSFLLLVVKFGAKVKIRNSKKNKNEVIFEVFHQQKVRKKKERE